MCKSIVNHIGRNRYVTILDQSALDREVIRNRTPIVVYTLYNHGNFALVNEVGGYVGVSDVGYGVINTFNKVMSANRNVNCRSLV